MWEVTIWDWPGNSPSLLMKKGKDCAFRMQQTRPMPTANFLPRPQTSPVQWSEPWNAQCVLSPRDQLTSGLNTNKAVGNAELTAEGGNWKLRESLPGEEPGAWNIPSEDRKAHRLLKDGSSQHAACQPGVKRNTQTNHGLAAASISIGSWSSPREGLCPTGWCSQPQRLLSQKHSKGWGAQTLMGQHSLTSAGLTPSYRHHLTAAWQPGHEKWHLITILKEKLQSHS